MKKKALCIFMLIFWMVAAATLLSIKVEEQMVPQVTIVSPQDNRGSRSALPADCLQMDEDGFPHLFSTYEGTGWEAGTRVREESGSYMLTEKGLELDSGWGDYVQYASKPLRSGEIVEVVRGGKKEADYWLAVFPDGIPEQMGELPSGMDVAEQSGDAMLISVEKADLPYMTGRVKSLIPEAAGAEVYSFAEMEKFLDALTAVGLVLGILTAAVTLWVCCCFMAKEPRKNLAGMIINITLGLLLLVGLFFTLRTMELPSSMLPREQITDFGYFYHEYHQFFSALKSFTSPNAGVMMSSLPQTPAAQEIIGYKNDIIMRPFLLAALGVALPLALRFVEWAVQYKRSLPKIK